MVKPVQKAEISSFVKGLISEASPLNFPADASRDEENFELNRDGSRNRRFGMDLEADYSLRSTGYTAAAIGDVATSTFKWLGAGNNPESEFVVVQFGSHIDIYRAINDSISNNGYIGSVTLNGVTSDLTFSYAAIDGKLVIAAGTETIHVIEWKNDAPVYLEGRLLVRDLWGLPGLENNDVNIRPTVLTDAHLYNLRNQGWGIPRKDSSGTLSDPIAVFYNGVTTTNSTAPANTGISSLLGRTLLEAILLVSTTSTTPNNAYPSNAESVYTGLQFQSGNPPFERMYPSMYDEVLGLNEQAARGYFIIDALKRGVSRRNEEYNNRLKYSTLVYAVSNIKADTTTGGASVVADFGGRVFYGGFNGDLVDPEDNSPNLSNYVLFSQVVRSSDDMMKCYQSGDPTSREGSDVVDSDGGFIRISGAKKIVGMRVLANNLFVLADNGVWKISGGGDYGFTATNFRVDKISSFGGFSEKTLIEVNDSLYFWGEEGIFQVNRNQFGDWVCNNISQTTVQSIYDAIPVAYRKSAIGTYDLADKKIRWLYGIDRNTSSTVETMELVLDLVLGSFSKNRVYNVLGNSPRLVGYIKTPTANSVTESVELVASTVPIVIGSDSVIITETTNLPRLTSIKFIAIHSTVGDNVAYTFAQYRDEGFRDWKSVDSVGVDAKAYLLTGTATAGDSSVNKQAPWLVLHFLKTENGVTSASGELMPAKQSSCLIRSQWNWATSAVSGNWGNLFQAYRYRRPLFITGPLDAYDNGFETVITKNKLRGRGKALSLYMETEPDKDCIILGWSLSLTGNNLP